MNSADITNFGVYLNHQCQTYSNVLKFWYDGSAMAQIKRQRKVNCPNIEEAMSMWVERAIWNGLTITDHILQVKSERICRSV